MMHMCDATNVFPVASCIAKQWKGNIEQFVSNIFVVQRNTDGICVPINGSHYCCNLTSLYKYLQI